MFEKINYHYHFQSRCLGDNLVGFAWEQFKNLIVFVNDNFWGIIFSVLFVYLIKYFLRNHKIIREYKRENKNNYKKYITQRCYEDGFGYDKNGKLIESEIKKEKDKSGNEHDVDKKDEDIRDYFYLVEKNGKQFYRIVDSYTLNRLGYPRPSRRSEKCFKLADKDPIGKEIKIYNIISDISGILKLKDNIKK